MKINDTWSLLSLTEEEHTQNAFFAEGMYLKTIELGKEHTHCFSKGIGDTVTAGYGRLDESGYFEFPLDVNQETLEIVITRTESF